MPAASVAEDFALGAAVSSVLPALLDSQKATSREQELLEPIEVEFGMLEFKDLEGKSFNQEDLKGDGAVVVFWSMYCRSCPSTVKAIEGEKEALAEKGFRFLPVHLFEKDPAKILSFIASSGLPINTLAAGNWAREALGIRMLPAVVVFDKKGEIVARVQLKIDNGKVEVTGRVNKP